MPSIDPSRPVVVLGAGVNGASVARELVLNGVPVWLVDASDIAAGATSKSSRLIHGGLRYLEYGEFGLVRESIVERDRLRRLAPQFVEPLRLYIPIARRFSGVATSALRFLGASRLAMFRQMAKSLRNERGLWLVRIGLALYDRFASNADFPSHTVLANGDPSAPRVSRERGEWLCAYSDGQMRYPERFNVALVQDAARAAAERGVEFLVRTHHAPRIDGSELVLTPVEAPGTQHMIMTDDRPPQRVGPSLIVNATGAWGDFTLRELGVPAPPLFGGTKGSHFLTRKPSLVGALKGAGLYAEAADGRLVFVLPFGDGVLVGTTDERYEDRPERAVATEPELDYLVGMVNSLIPEARVTRPDIEFHCCGVRPLPRAVGGATSAISRDHDIVEHRAGETPVLTLVGGKLTTCRAFGEIVADRVLKTLGMERTASTRDRIVPGGEDYPANARAISEAWQSLAARRRITVEQARKVWELFGTRADEVLGEPSQEASDNGDASHEVLVDTELPLAVVRHVLRYEWAKTLDDLVERRLMLVWGRHLTQRTLERLAALLVESGLLPADQARTAVDSCIERLRVHYGRTVRATTHESTNHATTIRGEG